MLKGLIQKGKIIHNPDFTKKEELFHWIAQDCQVKGLIESAENFYTALIDRENRMSTEIEPGIGFPHTKHNSVKELFIYVIISEKGIKFGGLGSKVKLAFLVGAPFNSQHYLDVMAGIARLLNNKDIKKALIKAENNDEILKIIENYSHTSSTGKEGKKDRFGLFLVLNHTHAMDTAMELAIELGIKGTVVMDSTNVAAKVAHNFPFASLFMVRNDKLSSHLLIGVAENENISSRLYAHLKKEGVDLDSPGVGTLFTLPLASVYGGIDEDLSY